MNSGETTIEILFEKAESYGKSSVELLKLTALEKTADVVSSLAVNLVIIIVTMICTLFINLGIAFWLGYLMGKTYYGFFVMAGFYAIVTLIIYSYRKRCIKMPLQNNIIKQILQQKTI